MSNPNEILLLAGKITTFLMLLPIAVGIWKWQRLNKPLKAFFYFCLVSFLLNILELLFVWICNNRVEWVLPFLKWAKIGNTNFVHIFYGLKNYIFLGWFYSYVFKPASLAHWVKPAVWVLCIVSLINYFFIEGYNVASGFNYIVPSIFCWLPPMVFMWYIFREDSKVPLTRNSYFWIFLSLIVSNLPSFLQSFMGQKIYETDFLLFVTISSFKNFFLIIGVAFRTIGFWNARYVRFLP